MNLYDCIFTENDIKQLQDCRDRQKDAELKLKIIAILSVFYSNSGVKAAIKQTAEIFGKHTETIKNRLRQYLTGGAEKSGSFSYFYFVNLTESVNIIFPSFVPFINNF